MTLCHFDAFHLAPAIITGDTTVEGPTMPSLDFKGKQHIYAHHLTVPLPGRWLPTRSGR